MNKHRFSETAAAKMLAEGLRFAAAERGVSLREIGRRLGYKQPVVLSHMASGRVPVPIDRASAIAEQVGIPRDHFLEAVLQQHHPQIEWGLVTAKPDPLVSDLEQAAGRPFSGLSAAHHHVLREVVQDSHPEERWLSKSEIAAVKFFRELFPRMQTSGLSEEDRETLRLAADLISADERAHSHHQPITRSKKNES